MDEITLNARLTLVEFLMEVILARSCATTPGGQQLLADIGAEIKKHMTEAQPRDTGIDPEYLRELQVTLSVLSDRFFARAEERRVQLAAGW